LKPVVGLEVFLVFEASTQRSPAPRGLAMTRLWLTLAILLAPLGYVSAADKPAVQNFDSNGTKIAYVMQGTGEPVILIHGWLSSAGINWVLPGISGQLARKYQVIALDVRGHGLSGKPTENEAYGPELVEDVVRLMNHLKIKKAHIVGYSMGGIITANFLSRHSDRALSGTLGGMGWLRQGSPEQALFAANKKKNPTDVCFRSLAKLALTDDEVKAIKAPVCILFGDEDFLKKGYTEPLLKVRKDWPVTDIKDANHITCILKPQFRDEIAAWLKKNSK
jgi:pimeloyl-ACP methyl ester carboxylesterase